MKRSFSLLEIIIVITLVGFLYTIFIPKTNPNKLDEITNRISLYLSYVRFKAMIDDKYDENDTLWHKKRWTIKFFRCRNKEDGIYFTIYSDKNKTGHPSVEDTLKDPLTNKYIYSSNYCQENEKNSEYVLLTKKFNIEDISIDCNSTTSLGQLSFGSDGRVYSKLSNFENEFYEYEIEKECKISIKSKNGKEKEIKIYSKSGFIE
ncbi:MAG: Tfp pilus assembly protein FimT/FimU [Arcobacter sp.]|uniref:pilus assembly FimT family protein n=1 Tax=Arcobacter sp. TaxID=1872629 RepID=UPI003D064F0E